MKKILNLVLAYVLIFNSVFASTITNNLNVGGDSNITGSSFISKILSIAGSFVTPDSKVDGSFENGTTQWVVSSGSSLTATSTDFADGSKSGSLSLLTGGTADLCADMTKLNGRDIEASAEFKNSGTGLQICTLKNSVESTCNTITPDSYWKNWSSISKAVGSGQHCLRIKNPTAGTLTALVDSAKIGKYTYQTITTNEDEGVSYTGYLSKNATNYWKFGVKRTPSHNGILITDSNTGDHTRFTVNKFAYCSIDATLDYLSANNFQHYIIHYDVNNNQIDLSRFYLSAGSNVASSVPLNTWVNAGDYFVVLSDGTGSNNLATHFNMNCTASKDNLVKTWEPSDRIGETIYLPQNVAPRGFISAMGSSIGKTSGTYQGDTYYNLYKVLWNVALNTAGQPYYISAAKGTDALTDWDAGKTITIDESGLFTRAYKSGTTNGVGQKQDDAFQGHFHDFWYAVGNTYQGGTFEGTVKAGATGSTGVQNVKAPTSDGTNGTPRTSNETRPINVAKYVFIRYATSEPVVLALPTAKQQDYYIEAGGNAGQTIAINTQDIPWTLITQKNAIWDGTGFIAPEDGLYNIEGWIYNSASGPTGVTPYVNGVAKNRMGLVDGNGKLSGTIPLLKDQRLSFRYDNGTSWTVVNSLWLHWIKINRINGKNDSVAVGEVPKNQVAIVQYRGNGTRTTLSTAPVAMPLTTVKGDSTIVSIASNQFTLQAGEYDIDLDSYLSHADTQGWAYGYLFSISDSAEIDRTIAATGATIGDTSYSRLSVRLSIPSTKTYEVRFISSGTGTHYLGNTNASPNDLNSFIKITKLNGN